MNHASLLKLLGELAAQRDDFMDWQAQAMQVVGRLVNGQPEVQPGVGALTVLEQYVGRLVKEKAALEIALAARESLPIANGEPFHRATAKVE